MTSQPYPSSSAPGYPPGYPPAYSPESPLPPAPAYPSAGSYSAVPQKKSPVLAIIGLCLVGVCAIIFCISSYSLFNVYFNLFGTDWVGTGRTPDTSHLTDAQASQLFAPMTGLILSAAPGIVGFILSIVATAQNKGRIFGIIGIILGIIAPFTLFIGAFMSMSAHGAL